MAPVSGSAVAVDDEGPLPEEVANGVRRAHGGRLPGEARPALDVLRDAGVPARWANEGAFTYTHEKAMVVDGRVAGIFTANMTSSGVYCNREFGVLDSSRSDATPLATVFVADWQRRSTHAADPRLASSPIHAPAPLPATSTAPRRAPLLTSLPAPPPAAARARAPGYPRCTISVQTVCNRTATSSNLSTR